MNKYTFFYFLWVLIILPKAFQTFFSVVILLFLFYKYSFPKKIPQEVIFLIGFSFLQILSVLLNSFFGYGTSRILAGLNTSLAWFTGILYYIFYLNIKISRVKIEKIMIVNYFILVIMSFITVVLASKGIEISMFSRKLYAADWFLGNTNYRLVGFMEYPNLAMLFGLITMPLLISYYTKCNKFLLFFIILLISYPIYLTKSRMGILLLIIGIGYILYTYYLYDGNKKYFVLVLFIGSILLVTLTKDYHEMTVFIDSIISGREGSTSARQNLYADSIVIVLKNNPLFGMGIKTIDTNYMVPYGSHSTYIGTLYKTGLVGFIMMVIGFFKIFLKAFKLRKSKENRVFLFFLFLFFISLSIEDIDGNLWLLVYFFSIMGIFFNENAV